MNSNAVTSAPIQTSRHKTLASGKYLNISMNNSVTTVDETPKSINCVDDDDAGIA